MKRLLLATLLALLMSSAFCKTTTSPTEFSRDNQNRNLNTNFFADTEPPSVPTGLVVSNITATTIDLKWSPSTDNVHVFGYEIYRDGAWAGATVDTFLTVTNLPTGSTFNITISSFDDAGNLSTPSSPISVTTPGAPDTEKPSVPAGLVATNATPTSFTLSWNRSTDNVGIAFYEIYQNGGWLGGTADTSFNITGLLPTSSYTFKVAAYDAAGNSSGTGALLVIGSVDTEAPSIPQNLTATEIQANSVILSWDASTDNNGTPSYQYYINDLWVGGTSDLFKIVPGLTCGTTYKFAVDAYDGASPANISAQSNPIIVTTLACAVIDTEKPTVPTGLVISDITETTIHLAWNASTDNVGVHGYEIYKNGGWAGATVDTFMVLSGLAPGSTFDMSLSAFDDAGNYSAPTSPISVTTLGAVDTEKPSIPSGLSVSNITQNTIDLKWNPSTDNVGVHGYEIYKNGGWAGATVDTFMVLTGFAPGSTFDINLSAFDDAGNYSAACSAITVTTLGAPDTEKPSVPTGLVISDITETTILMAWNASTDNVGVHGYEIYKNGGWAGATVDTFMVLTGLPPASTFNISLSAFDNAGNYSAPTTAVSVTTTGVKDTEKPSIPTGLDVSNITETTIDLKWNPSTDNVHVFGYEIYTDGKWAGATTDTFLTVKNLAPGTTFKVTISAFDDSNNLSMPSAPLSVTTLGTPPPKDTEKPSVPTGLIAYNITQTSVTISWNPSTDNVGIAFYEIYKNGGWLGGTVDTFMVIKDLPMGSTFNINLSAYDAANNLSAPCKAISVKLLGDSDTQAPSVPSGIVASAVTDSSFTLTWAASTDNLHVFGYEVFLDGVWAGATTETTLGIKDLLCGKTYNVQLNAFDDAGNISEKSPALPVSTIACIIDALPETLNAGISVWPNPVSSTLHMKDVPADAKITIFAADGKVVTKVNSNDKTLNLDVSNWKKGIYFLKVQTGNRMKIEKIVVD